MAVSFDRKREEMNFWASNKPIYLNDVPGWLISMAKSVAPNCSNTRRAISEKGTPAKEAGKGFRYT